MRKYDVHEPGGGGAASIVASGPADAIARYRAEAEAEYGPGDGWGGVVLLVVAPDGSTTRHDAETGAEVEAE